MPKMKTKKTLAKRVKKTGTGKLMKKSNYTSHFAANKTHKQKKHLQKRSAVDKSGISRIKELLQG